MEGVNVRDAVAVNVVKEAGFDRTKESPTNDTTTSERGWVFRLTLACMLRVPGWFSNNWHDDNDDDDDKEEEGSVPF